jgi:hypothetical protein
LVPQISLFKKGTAVVEEVEDSKGGGGPQLVAAFRFSFVVADGAPVIHFFRTRICSLVGGVEDAPTGTDATAGYAVSASAHQRLTWGLPRSRTWRGWGTKGCKNWGCTTAFVGGMMGVCRKKIIYAASRGAMGICSKKKSVTAFYSVNNLILARYRILAVIFQFWVVWGIC